MQIFINVIQLELDEMLSMQEYLQQMMKKNCGGVVSWGQRPQKLFKMLHFLLKDVLPSGGVELREFKLSQIKRHTNPDRYI